MDSVEIRQELNMTYDELVHHLLAKYGAAKYSYFYTETCKNINKKNSRTSEGLYCHHMDEDKALKLSEPEYAITYPFEYQKAERLVYANVLEHLLLHIKIIEKVGMEDPNNYDIPGLGGVVTYMCPQINDYFNGYEFKRPHLVKIFSLIENNFDDYIAILKYFLKLAEEKLPMQPPITKDSVSHGWDGKTVMKVYERL